MCGPTGYTHPSTLGTSICGSLFHLPHPRGWKSPRLLQGHSRHPDDHISGVPHPMDGTPRHPLSHSPINSFRTSHCTTRAPPPRHHLVLSQVLDVIGYQFPHIPSAPTPIITLPGAPLFLVPPDITIRSVCDHTAHGSFPPVDPWAYHFPTPSNPWSHPSVY